MKKINLVTFVLSLTFAASCQNIKEDKSELSNMSKIEIKVPAAKKIPKELKIHDDVRIDNYYWLNERENPEVINYLNQENEYYDTLTSKTKEFQKNLFEEMKSRIKEDDASVPYKKKGYFYITRYETGKQYPIHTRKKGNLKAKEEIIFNVNEMAEGKEYYALTG